MADVTRFRILTLNCWGVHYVSKKIAERFESIAKEIKRQKYDIVAFQEVWYKGDYEFVASVVESELPFHIYFYSGVVGSGLCIYSRYPIVSARSLPFKTRTGVFESFNRGYPGQGELFAGKGIMSLRLQLPTGCVTIYNTHTEVCSVHHSVQLFEAFQFISETSGSEPIILCGDLNAEDSEVPYSLLTDVYQFKDTFQNDRRITCNLPDNVFTVKGRRQKRIDYIFYTDNGCAKSKLILCKKSFALSGKIPGQDFNWSDHEGLEATFELSPRSSEAATEPSVRKLFLGEDVNSERNRLYYKHLSTLCDDITKLQATIGCPPLIKTSARAYTIWMMFVALLLSTLFIDFSILPFALFLAMGTGIGMMVIYVGMLLDMNRIHVLKSIYKEIYFLKNSIENSDRSVY